MQMERLTIKAQEALQGAQTIAQRFSHQEIDGEHLMLALLDQTEGLIQPLLQKLGAAPAARSRDLESGVGAPRQGDGRDDRGHVPEHGVEEGARRRAVRGGQTQGRLRQHRTSAARPARRGRAVAEEDFPDARPQARRGAARRWPNCAATSASPTRIPRTNSRRWKNTAAT